MYSIETIGIKIDNVLESLLSDIYTELNIQNGDIAPEQEVEWKRMTTDMAGLFTKLIEQNS